MKPLTGYEKSARLPGRNLSKGQAKVGETGGAAQPPEKGGRKVTVSPSEKGSSHMTNSLLTEALTMLVVRGTALEACNSWRRARTVGASVETVSSRRPREVERKE